MNEFQALPDTVHVRVHLLIRQSGFRPKQIILVTTLLDLNAILKQNSLSSIICAGKRRKSISSTSKPLNMEMIWAKSPQMVRKEIWMHLLAYNLLRNLMWTSAELAQVPPMRISCKALGNC